MSVLLAPPALTRTRRTLHEVNALLALAGPIIIAQLANTAMGFVDTLMAGRVAKSDLPAGLDLSLEFRHDALDQIGGSEASFFLARPFQTGVVRLTPNAGLNWTAARLAGHDYGVPLSKAAADRPAYDPGDTFSPEAGVRLLAELTGNWWIAASLSAELLGREVTRSSLVEEDVLIKGFLAVQYVF